MNINSVNNAAYTYGAGSGEPAAPRTQSRAEMFQSTLNKIARKYPNLDRDLAKALVTEKEIENSDTWEGLKWYEVPVAPLAIKANKMMKAEHRRTVAKLQDLVTARNNIQAALASL